MVASDRITMHTGLDKEMVVGSGVQITGGAVLTGHPESLFCAPSLPLVSLWENFLLFSLAVV